MKRMELEGGLEIVTFGPPKDFDPLTAAAGDLEKNGFQSFPDSAHHRERFKRVFGQLKNKFHYIQPTMRVNKEKVHGPRAKRPTDGTETSTNWSGAVVYAPAGQSFSWVQGDWIVPDVDAPTENEWYYCASWIGIDGDGSGDVFQAGVECDVYRSGSTITRNIYPWWEWYPTPEVQMTNLPMNPGDMVTMLLCSAQGAGSTKGTVFFTNRTTGASTSVALTAPEPPNWSATPPVDSGGAHRGRGAERACRLRRGLLQRLRGGDEQEHHGERGDGPSTWERLPRKPDHPHHRPVPVRGRRTQVTRSLPRRLHGRRGRRQVPYEKKMMASGGPDPPGRVTNPT